MGLAFRAAGARVVSVRVARAKRPLTWPGHRSLPSQPTASRWSWSRRNPWSRSPGVSGHFWCRRAADPPENW